MLTIYPILRLTNMKNKSLFEIINSFALNIIYIVNSTFRLENLNNKQKFILCYHSVGNSGWRFATPDNNFEDQMIFLKKNYNVVGLSELLKSKSGGVAITFDDGYKDVFVNAYPIMKKLGIKGTIFVLGDDKNANRNELENNLEFMTKSDILTLKQSGWEVGSHTNTHANLYVLNNKELVDEISNSKKKIEERLKTKVNYFAYPKGKYNNEIIDVVEKSGYTKAFTVDSGFYDDKNSFKITRLPMEGVVGINQYAAIISYIGLLIESIFMWILKRKERLTG